MYVFSGFPQGESRTISLPEQFFCELLAHVDDLAELKVLLFALYISQKMGSSHIYLQRADFTSQQSLVDGFATTAEDPQTNLDQALARAVQRGFLLQTNLVREGEPLVLYFINNARGRAAMESIERGDWRWSTHKDRPLELDLDKPNIFQIYEDHIGTITPMIAENLIDAEREYPLEWIEEAVRIAVEKNVRNWRYVSAILKRWKKEGKLERKDQQDTQEARRRYAEWEN